MVVALRLFLCGEVASAIVRHEDWEMLVVAIELDSGRHTVCRRANTPQQVQADTQEKLQAVAEAWARIEEAVGERRASRQRDAQATVTVGWVLGR